MVLDSTGMRELLEKKAFLLDVEGVICDNIDEGKVLENVIEFIDELKGRGIKIAIVTNISRKPRRVVHSKLIEMGIPVEEKELFTSGATTALYIRSHFPDKKCFVLSEWGLRHDIEHQGIDLADEGYADIVAIGANRRITYNEINHAMRLVLEGAELICSGTTLRFKGNFLGESGFFLGEAAIAEAISVATGHQITYIGKPHPEIFEQVLSSMGVDARESLMIGDTLSSDIAGANRSGIDSLLLTRGLEIDVNKILEDERPKYISKSLKDLYGKLF